MKVVVALEGRFALRHGLPASHHLTYDRMWKRYLQVFGEVIVVGRLFPQEDQDALPVEGPGVRFFPLPAYTGPREYLLRRRELRRRLEEVCSSDCAYILRVPGSIGNLLWSQLRRKGYPYAVEVVGDPYDVFAAGSVRHPLRPFLRFWMPRQLRRQCQEAQAAAYVTEGALQRRYPCPQYMGSYSSVTLPDEAFVQSPRSRPENGSRTQLITVGDMNQLYKAPHVLIDAVARCVHSGLDLGLTMVGKGTYLEWLRKRAAQMGIGNRVEFTGRLPGGAPVRDALDRADLFVLPSYQEGLPRAMIEAMARGLPCIGSSVGGIGELLEPDALVRPGDSRELAVKIADVVTNSTRMAAMSARNLVRARLYRSAALQERRVAFYRIVRDRTREVGPLGVQPSFLL